MPSVSLPVPALRGKDAVKIERKEEAGETLAGIPSSTFDDPLMRDRRVKEFRTDALLVRTVVCIAFFAVSSPRLFGVR